MKNLITKKEGGLGVLLAILFALFWAIWFFVFGFVPESSFLIAKGEREVIDFLKISRWWDVLFAPFLVILFFKIIKKVKTMDDDFKNLFLLGLIGGGVIWGIGFRLIFGGFILGLVCLLIGGFFAGLLAGAEYRISKESLVIPLSFCLGSSLGVGLGLSLVDGMLVGIILGIAAILSTFLVAIISLIIGTILSYFLAGFIEFF